MKKNLQLYIYAQTMEKKKDTTLLNPVLSSSNRGGGIRNDSIKSSFILLE